MIQASIVQLSSKAPAALAVQNSHMQNTGDDDGGGGDGSEGGSFGGAAVAIA